jgi:predicted aconitase
MYLSDEEKAMLDGAQGPAIQKAMELLIKYGEAVDAENLVDTNSVSAGVIIGRAKNIAEGVDAFDAFFSEFHLDCDPVNIPPCRAATCTILHQMDANRWKIQGISEEVHALGAELEEACHRIGFAPTYTCAPYLVGYVPLKGQHCAWMESSAVPICNSVFGARTNTEGFETAGAAMLTGKIPNWGYHLDENRRGDYLVQLDCDVVTSKDWGLLGYSTGWEVADKIPVFNGIKKHPDLIKLMQCSAAGASSGGVEMFHIVEVTPEAKDQGEAFGGKRPIAELRYGNEERRAAYDKLRTAKGDDVDFVTLGCPHYSPEQIWRVSMLLEGKKLAPNTQLWIHTPHAIKAMADRAGYTDIIERTGAYIMTDTCPNVSKAVPAGTRTVATDSPKQSHHIYSILNLPAYFGSMEECLDAALTGKWRGSLDG